MSKILESYNAEQDITLTVIQELIPLGLKAVGGELQREVQELTGKRYQRGDEISRWGSQPGSTASLKHDIWKHCALKCRRSAKSVRIPQSHQASKNPTSHSLFLSEIVGYRSNQRSNLYEPCQISTKKCIDSLLMGRSSFFLMLLLWSFLGVVYGDPVPNQPAPFFRVYSGEDQQLTSDMLKGKVAVVFYEAKSQIEKNRTLKNELNKFYAGQSESVQRSIVKLPIVNCSKILFTSAWKKGLRDASQNEGMTVYGDWTGQMFLDYQLKDKESSVMIIDKEGILRFFASGVVAQFQFKEIKNILLDLVKE